MSRRSGVGPSSVEGDVEFFQEKGETWTIEEKETDMSHLTNNMRSSIAKSPLRISSILLVRIEWDKRHLL